MELNTEYSTLANLPYHEVEGLLEEEIRFEVLGYAPGNRVLIRME